MNNKDPLGDRMKLYESVEAGRKLMPLLPVVIRLDGKSFSKWTRGLERPYDARLARVMSYVTRCLVEETGARIGYTQSDEISLVLKSDTFKSEIYFGGKIAKINSVLASLASVRFAQAVAREIPSHGEKLALFDCRCWNVPNETEAANAILWRERDATKNSISSAARHHYSHAALHGKSSPELQELLLAKGINWNDYPSYFKRGSFLQRRTTSRVLTPEELEALPEKHSARRDPGSPIVRSAVLSLPYMPPFGAVQNREDVIFRGEDPAVNGEKIDATGSGRSLFGGGK